MYVLEFHPAALRELRHLRRGIPQATYGELEGAISGLADNPRPEGFRHVVNTPYLRIRVARVYRVIYQVDEEARHVVVVRVARRGEATYHGLP